MSDRPIDEIRDAYDFRETLIPKADSIHGAAPLWHGWALAECYWAGMERERVKCKKYRDALVLIQLDMSSDPYTVAAEALEE
jgi:hypothetical protein